MRATIIPCLSAVGFFGRLPALDLGSGAPSQNRQDSISCEKQTSANAEAGGPDAYKVAVLLLAGVTILTLF
jgi:hypothetical protein